MVPPAPRRPAKSAPAKPAGEVRIIAGSLRGSKLPVLDAAGLRPTADRVRETLFNWLQQDLPGARVVDLFAGSGALAFEAASRGAARVIAIERSAPLARSLQAQADRLRVADRLEVRCGDALGALLDAEYGQVDGVFIDPPFAADLWPAALAQAQRLLKPRGWIYLECPRALDPQPPAPWQRHREGSTREVRYALYRRGAAVCAADTA